MIVSAVIRSALRKLGALAAGADPTPSETADALETLRSQYLEMVGAGTFGRQYDVAIPQFTADFNANENRRYTVEDLRDIAITLPQLLNDTWARWDFPEYGALWVPPQVQGEPLANARPPRDHSIVTASDLNSSITRTFVYDAAIGRWVSLQDLALTDVAPLTTRYSEGIICDLAIRLAPDYGQEPSISIVRGAAQGRSAMVCKFDTVSRPSVGVYF